MSDVTPLATVRTEEDARRHMTRIRLTAGIVRENLPRLWNLIEEARNNSDDRILGYTSWTAYVSDAFSDEPMRLPRDERQQLVAMLAGEGMSTRAIAPIVGASRETVAADLRGGRNLPPVEPEGVQDSPPHTDVPDLPVNPQTGEVYEAGDADHGSPEVPVTVTETHSVKRVTGLDGKEYTKAPPKEPRRTSLIDDARNAGWQLRKAVERLERIHQDDRFTKNKVEILAALQPHLDFANEVFSDL